MKKLKELFFRIMLKGMLALSLFFLLFAKNEIRAAEEEKLPDAAVVFQDENLERLVRDSLSIYDREIRQSDIADVTSIQLENHNIKDITGLENFKNLKKLDMSGNVIEDIQPLASLQSLEYLDLSWNEIEDIGALKGLTNLKNLNVSGNAILEVSALSNLKNLEQLYLEYNRITSLEGVDRLPALEKLNANNNRIKVIPSMEGLYSLKIKGNPVRDYTGLAHIPSIEYDMQEELSDIRMSFLSEKFQNYIRKELQDDSLEVEWAEWMKNGSRDVLRVQIAYKEQPKADYKHKEDYFFFMEEGISDPSKSQVLHVTYENGEDKTGSDGNTTRKRLRRGCDFTAVFEDVTFDGNNDLLIAVGGDKGGEFYCAYVYENGFYRYEPSFEKIPCYKVDPERQLVCGTLTDSDGRTISEWTYNGEFVKTGETLIPREN